MRTEYKITTESKKKYLYKIAWGTLSIHIGFLPLFFYYRNITDNYLISIISFAVVLGWVFVFGLPLFVLYYNHYKYSKGIVFRYDNGTFFYIKGKKATTFKMSEVTKVELYLTNVAFKESIDLLYVGKYHYMAIYTKAHPVICISCLVCDSAIDIFPDNLIAKTGKAFPLIPKEQKEFIPFKEKSRVEQLVEKYAGKSDEELNEILTHQKDYQKEAVEAAGLVLKSREQAPDSRDL